MEDDDSIYADLFDAKDATTLVGLVAHAHALVGVPPSQTWRCWQVREELQELQNEAANLRAVVQSLNATVRFRIRRSRTPLRHAHDMNWPTMTPNPVQSFSPEGVHPGRKAGKGERNLGLQHQLTVRHTGCPFAVGDVALSPSSWPSS